MEIIGYDSQEEFDADLAKWEAEHANEPNRMLADESRAIAGMFDRLADGLREDLAARERDGLTDAQRGALARLCKNYHVAFDASQYTPAFDLPTGWVAGWVGPIYVGCSPEGDIHS